MNLTALSEAETYELRLRLEAREQYNAASDEERLRITNRAALESDFSAFFRAAWSVLEPGNTLAPSWHYELIAEYLTLVAQRKIRRLIINVPPRTAKTTEATICFPDWVWAKYPETRFLTASYSMDLSREHSVKRRLLLRSPWFQQHWPITLADDADRQNQFRNAQQGEMIATSVGASGTGRGGNILILDDGLSADEAISDAKRKAAHEWFKNTWRTRMNDPSRDAMVVIEQRTHEEDVTGWLLQKEPGQWTHIRIPLEAEEDERWEFPISGRIVERLRGAVLMPERNTPEVMASFKVHSRTFATQYQQRPAPAGGIICKREWWKFYSKLPDKADAVIDSWDFAFKDKKENDPVCGFKVVIAGAQRYFVAAKWGLMDFTASVEALKQLALQAPASSKKLVEDKANGPAIINSLQNKVPGIVAVPKNSSKEACWYAASGDIEAGNVFLPDPKYFPEHRWWVEQLIEEWAVAPNGQHDDGCDASAQAINETRKMANAFLAYYTQKNDQRDEAKAETAKRNAPKPVGIPRQWSEHIRNARMGIQPIVVDVAAYLAELQDWLLDAEAAGDTPRAKVAQAEIDRIEGK